MLVATCPKCEKQSNVSDSNRGRRIRCTGCQAIYQVTTEPPAGSLPPPRPAAPPPLPQRYGPGEELNEPTDEAAAAAAAAAPQWTGAARGQARFGPWAAMIVLGLLAVGGGVFAAVYFK